jgi:hypothetical protein
MSENDENAPKEKRSFFGFRRTNKIEKAKNIPEVISRILKIPKDKIIVNNKAYADKKEKERKEKEKQQKDQEATDKFNEYLKNTRDGTSDGTSDGNQTNDLNTDSSSGPSDSSGDPTQSTTGPSGTEGTTTPSETTSQDESSSKKAPSKALPIISSFQFDPSIGEEQQTKIKNIMGNLNNMLRLPELGLFADDEIQGKTDSVITVEKIIDDDGEKQNPPKEIYIEPLIQIVE